MLTLLHCQAKCSRDQKGERVLIARFNTLPRGVEATGVVVWELAAHGHKDYEVKWCVTRYVSTGPALGPSALLESAVTGR